MWRDGLTIIALESRQSNREPAYLTFDQAQAADGIAVEEAPVQTVPTIDAATGPMAVLLLCGDTTIGANRGTTALADAMVGHRLDLAKTHGSAEPRRHGLIHDRRAVHVALFGPA
jgi:hypothetical protein